MKKKMISLLFLISMLIGAIPLALTASASGTNATATDGSDIPLKLWYDEEALEENENSPSASTTGANSDIGWERWSLPIGNGYFGANVFGRTETERIQITEKTLMNPTSVKDSSGTWYTIGGLNSFSETYIDFNHTNSQVSDYSRYLDLKTAISGVEYKYNGVTYTREYFTSYPDRALVIRLDADTDGALSFTLRPTIPYEQSHGAFTGDGVTKSGTVTSRVTNGVGEIELAGKMSYYDIDFLGLYRVYTDGGSVTASSVAHTYKDTDGKEITDTDGTIVVSGAKSAYIVVTLGTDYVLSEDVFTSADTSKPTKNTTLEDTRAKVGGYMTAIDEKLSGKSFDEAYNTLKNAHISDHDSLFGRVGLNLGYTEADLSKTTDKLLEDYQNGNRSAYLEALIFQYGRYLLIASSRSGALPANLQGAWNTYNTPPWAAAYTHNINVQMNYWPAFSTNLAETFEAYVAYNEAYMKQAEAYADDIIKTNNPDALDKDGGNGWVIGNHIYPYRYTSDRSAGNLGFITQVFWDYYSYTKDPAVLNYVYSILTNAARYITKCVEEDDDGNYLVQYCDSPEMKVNGVWYYTEGTTYAQTFAYLNNYHALEAARELGIDLSDSELLSSEEYSILATVTEQIDKYDPINVGLSGQIKEFREENYYSSLGDDPTHRHISQLVGLYPGNLINSSTPAWLDAAKVVLENRGNGSMGWSRAHRMNLWARVKEGDEAYRLFDSLIRERTAYNLWNIGPPFQIDGSFGATAGVSEMLLQSHEGYIEPLAALPSAWQNGSYSGLVARGNFEVAATWKDGVATVIEITSNSGGKASVYYPSITGATITDSDGNTVSFTTDGADLISFNTELGKTYTVSGFTSVTKPAAPADFTYTENISGGFDFSWSSSGGATSYNIYAAKGNASAYTLIANTTSTSYTYTPSAADKDIRTTYAVTAVGDRESDRALAYTTATVVTPYGEIPSSTLNSDVNFVIFAKKSGESAYKLLQTGTEFIDGGLDKARQYLATNSGAYQGGTVVIYLIKDCSTKGTASGAGWNAAFQVGGNIIVDLNGKKLTSTAPRLIGLEVREGLGYQYATGFEFKNGTLCTSKPIVEMFGSSGKYTGTKVCNVKFDGVTVEPNGNAFTLFCARGSYTSTQKAELNVELTNCTLNFPTLSGVIVLNDSCTGGAAKSTLTIKGGTVKAKSLTDLTLNKGFATEDSILFAKNSSGARTEFVLAYTATAPTVAFNTDDGIKYLASKGISNDVAESSRTTIYALSSLKTESGYIPEHHSAKTFSLFYGNLHIGSYDLYKNAIDRVKVLLYPANSGGIYAGGELTLYMHKNYEHTDAAYVNFAQIDGTLTIDLCGHVLTQKSNYLFDVVGKAINNTILETTAVIVKNGTILTNDMPIMYVNSKGTSGNFGYSGTKNFTFTYENVTFDKNSYVSVYSPLISVGRYDVVDGASGSKNVYISATFKDCSFNSDTALLFDLSACNYVDTDITVIGGNITANSVSSPAIMKSSDENDTLTFAKSESGNYTTLHLPSHASAPEALFNNGTLTFVKYSEDASGSTYKLSVSALLSYSPKISITLDSSIIMNVYIPEDKTLGFTLCGTSYANLADLDSVKVTLDGKSYYKMQIALDAKSAAAKMPLEVSVSYGDSTVTGRFNFSLLKYATKIFASGTTVEKQILRDVLSYVRAAYSYFGTDTDGTVAAIDSLIGARYDETAPHTDEGSTEAPDEGLSSVTFALNSTPALKFYIDGSASADKYEFYIGNKKLDTVIGSDSYGTYIEMDVYAYAMCETFTYFIDGRECGSYHIAAYFEWAKTQNNEKLETLVERFWKYCQSARDFKSSVTVKINYVDEDGNTLADSKTVYAVKGADISVPSPAVAGYYTRTLYYKATATSSAEVKVIYKKIPTGINSATAEEKLPNIASWGDSITAGSNTNNTTAANQHNIDLISLGSTANGGTYSEVLRNLIASKVYGGIEIANCGVGGETTFTIAARANTESYYLYLGDAVSISGSPVVIPLKQNTGGMSGRDGVFRKDTKVNPEMSNVSIIGTDANGNTVTVTGIITCAMKAGAPEGKYIWNCDSAYLEYTFTRTDGKTDVVNFASGTKVVTNASVIYDGRTTIIFMGENGGYNSDISTLIAQQEEILKACGNPEHYLIISSTSGSTESRRAITEALTARWGDRYINMGNELNSSRRAYEFVGYSEEAIVSVQENIINGTVSTLLLADSCHPNAVGYAFIGNVIFERLFDIGAFDAIFDYYDSLQS